MVASRDDAIRAVAAPLRKQVIESLRDAIVTFQYKPGDRLVERELCSRFNVSRTVIREALRHLEAEELVELVANHGPIVSVATPQEARHLYEVRETLEAMAARLCAERATPLQKRRLAQALHRVALTYQKDDLIDRLRAKDEFYARLCDGTQNDVIASMLRSVHARAQVLRSIAAQVPGRTEASLAELQALVTAIEKGDGELAGKLAADHVREVAALAFDQLNRADWGDNVPVRKGQRSSKIAALNR